VPLLGDASAVWELFLLHGGLPACCNTVRSHLGFYSLIIPSEEYANSVAEVTGCLKALETITFLIGISGDPKGSGNLEQKVE